MPQLRVSRVRWIWANSFNSFFGKMKLREGKKLPKRESLEKDREHSQPFPSLVGPIGFLRTLVISVELVGRFGLEPEAH